jgi:hypothetical protein
MHQGVAGVVQRHVVSDLLPHSTPAQSWNAQFPLSGVTTIIRLTCSDRVAGAPFEGASASGRRN